MLVYKTMKEGLNWVNHQQSNGLKFNRQPSKRYFCFTGSCQNRKGPVIVYRRGGGGGGGFWAKQGDI